MHDDNMEGLHAAAEDLLKAIESKDATALVSALHSFFEISDQMPHEEGPDEEEEKMFEGGQVWDDEESQGPMNSVTAQEKQSGFFGEKYR